MLDLQTFADADKSLDQPEDDGRALSVQQTIDAWIGAPRRTRTNVLRGLWKSEQRLMAIAQAPDTSPAGTAWARDTLHATRQARYLLRALANALDPRPPCEMCGEQIKGKRAEHVCAAPGRP